jgi:hypothetical protein
MSLAPCLTNIDNSSAPLFALSGQGGGGGGGGGTVLVASTLSISTITGNPEFLGNAVYMGQPNSLGGNDGLTFVTNPPNSFGAPLVSTVGVRYDMGGQVGYMLMNDTAGLGTGLGMNLLANGITLGSSQGVEIAGAAGSGAGSLIVSSISVSSINGGIPGAGTNLFDTASISSLSVSSINGAIPGGGGGGSALPIVSSIGVDTQTIWASGTGVTSIGPSFNVNQGSTYAVYANVVTISSIDAPVANDRLCFLADATVLNYIDLVDQVGANVHNPKGFQVGGVWQPVNPTAQFNIYCNGGAPSTVFQLDTSSVTLVELS